MKKLLVVLIVSLLMVGMVASASAYFSDTCTNKIVGKTGYVDITYQTYQINLPQNMQPGHSYTVSWWIKNTSTTCDAWVKVSNIRNKPSWLTVTILPGVGSYFKLSKNGGYKYVTLKVTIPPSVGNEHKNQTVTFYVDFYAKNA